MPSLPKVRLAGRCDCSTSWMISAFSDAGYLMPRPPHPRSCFFKQAVLQGEIGHHLLQGGGFTTKVLHLAGRRGAGGVARQPALAGLQELLRPAVIHRGGDAFPAAQLRDVLLATQSFQHNADLPSLRRAQGDGPKKSKNTLNRRLSKGAQGFGAEADRG